VAKSFLSRLTAAWRATSVTSDVDDRAQRVIADRTRVVDQLLEFSQTIQGAGKAEQIFAALAHYLRHEMHLAGIAILSHAPESVAKSWVVSLDADPLPLIQQTVQGLLDGSLPAGQTLAVPLQFTHINPSLFSPGKQALANQTLSDLQDDYIDTGVDLTTGEQRP
jgi:K+-sensing histidine kinase KdpD